MRRLRVAMPEPRTMDPRELLGKQLPPGMAFDESYRLPALARDAQCQLISVLPYASGGDPYVLLDRWGVALYQWPERYEPHWTEVASVCRQLGLAL